MVMRSLILFTYLQFLDALTTACFLVHGGNEANPIMKFLMGYLGTFEGLLVAKTFGVLVAVWYMAKGGSLKWYNGLYSAVVVWNMTYFLQGAK